MKFGRTWGEGRKGDARRGNVKTDRPAWKKTERRSQKGKASLPPRPEAIVSPKTSLASQAKGGGRSFSCTRVRGATFST